VAVYMSAEMNAKKHEFIGIFLLLAAVLLLLCLATYNPGDQSLNSLSRTSTYENSIGRIGAYISDFLFQVFGYAAYLLLAPLLILGYKLIRGRKFQAPYFRSAGFLILLLAACTALQMLPSRFPDASFMAGGITGVFLLSLLQPNLNRTGTIIVILGAMIMGILASTPLTLAGMLEKIGRKTSSPKPGFMERLRKWIHFRPSLKTVVKINKSTPQKPPERTPRPQPINVNTTPPSIQKNSSSLYTPNVEQTRPPLPTPQRQRFRKFKLPETDFLHPAENPFPINEKDLMERARLISAKCSEFDVHGSVTQIHPGPVVTTFEFKPDAGIKYSRITSLVDDLCLGIKAESARIDRIPGKATVGIEVPNKNRETIMLRELIESEAFRKSPSRLTLALGKQINGNPIMADLIRMPHLLIAGATGSGKSVALNCMVASILYKATPEDVRFILIDPKRLELGLYADIPHLLTPIVTDAADAAIALRWATAEMESRYKKLALRGVRNIDQYNSLFQSRGNQLSLLDKLEEEGEPEKPLSYLVLVIDELADLMMVASKEVEESISRLAAMARAVGIHLILATQRPSVDVITGIIKANFPCRISFKVASKVDSRTIIDANGAEQLLGNGDMLFIPPGTSRLTRIHGAFLTEKEVQTIARHLREQSEPTYDESVLSYGMEETDELGNPLDPGQQDSLYNEAVRVVVSEGRASTSLLQRRLSIGYGRAAKLIDSMYHNNLVSQADGSKPREVLVGLDYLDRLDEA
jgi:S-DNA-T family DNA segregation ATPase FtsK/SpoIIIE